MKPHRFVAFMTFAAVLVVCVWSKSSQVRDARLAIEINEVSRRCALLQAEVYGTTALRDYVVHQVDAVGETAVEEQASEIRVILRELTKWQPATREVILNDVEDIIRKMRVIEKNQKVLSDRVASAYRGPYGPFLRLLRPADSSASR